jgi:hypothetical protein
MYDCSLQLRDLAGAELGGSVSFDAETQSRREKRREEEKENRVKT